MDSPTIEELTSPNSSPQFPKVVSINGRGAIKRPALPSSPTIDELYPPSSQEATLSSQGSSTSPTDGAQSDSCTTPRKRPCRKAKVEAMDRSFAQTYRSPCKRTPRKTPKRSPTLDQTLEPVPGNDNTREMSSGLDRKDTSPNSKSEDVKDNESSPPLVIKSPVKQKRKTPRKRLYKRKSKSKVSKDDKETLTENVADKELLNGMSKVKNGRGTDTSIKPSKTSVTKTEVGTNQLKDSVTSDNDLVLSSTPTDPVKKKRVWDTSWWDDDAVPIPSDITLSSDKHEKDTEDDTLSSCFTGSQKTFSGPSSDDDSDDDLPDVFGSSVTNSKIEKGDLIWLKYGSFPFWPAIVRIVYRIKKQVKKITVAFIGDIKECIGHQHIRVGYKKQNVYPFASCGHDQHQTLKNEGMKSQYHEDFSKAYDQAEIYLFRKATDDSIDIFEYFSPLFKSMKVHTSTSASDIVEEEESVDKTIVPPVPSTPDSSMNTSGQDSVLSAYNSPGITEATQLRINNRTMKNQRLVEYIKQAECKDHLSDVFHGKFHSERHQLYFKKKRTRAEENTLRLGGYGPIADEAQQEEVVKTVIGYTHEWKRKDDEALMLTDYCLGVLAPEAIIFAIQKVFRQSRSKAEEMFYKGARFFKEEQKQMERQFDRYAHSRTPSSAESDSDPETEN